MLFYSLKCRKNKSKSTEVVIRKNGRIMLLQKCLVCNGKKSKFPKEQGGFNMRWLMEILKI